MKEFSPTPAEAARLQERERLNNELLANRERAAHQALETLATARQFTGVELPPILMHTIFDDEQYEKISDYLQSGKGEVVLSTGAKILQIGEDKYFLSTYNQDQGDGKRIIERVLAGEEGFEQPL